MITELVAAPFLALMRWLLGLLPDWQPDLPAVDSMVTMIAKIDSVIPIGGPLQMAVTVLGFVAVFFFIRLILTIRHVVLP